MHRAPSAEPMGRVPGSGVRERLIHTNARTRSRLRTLGRPGEGKHRHLQPRPTRLRIPLSLNRSPGALSPSTNTYPFTPLQVFCLARNHCLSPVGISVRLRRNTDRVRSRCRVRGRLRDRSPSVHRRHRRTYRLSISWSRGPLHAGPCRSPQPSRTVDAGSPSSAASLPPSG